MLPGDNLRFLVKKIQIKKRRIPDFASQWDLQFLPIEKLENVSNITVNDISVNIKLITFFSPCVVSTF